MFKATPKTQTIIIARIYGLGMFGFTDHDHALAKKYEDEIKAHFGQQIQGTGKWAITIVRVRRTTSFSIRQITA